MKPILFSLAILTASLSSACSSPDDDFRVGLVETPHDGAAEGGDGVADETPLDTGTFPLETGAPVDTGTPPLDTGTPVDTGTPPSDTGTLADTGTPTSEKFMFPTTSDKEVLKLAPRFEDPGDLYEGVRTTKLAKITKVTVSPTVQNWTHCSTSFLTFDVVVNGVKVGTMAVPPGSTATPGSVTKWSQTFSGLAIWPSIDKVTLQLKNASIFAGCGTVVVDKTESYVVLE